MEVEPRCNFACRKSDAHPRSRRRRLWMLSRFPSLLARSPRRAASPPSASHVATAANLVLGRQPVRLWNSGSHAPPPARPTTDAFAPRPDSGRKKNRDTWKQLGLQRLATVQLKSWVKHALEQCSDDVLRSAAQMEIKTSNVIRLPMRVRRWTVMRNPFVNKSAMDQFERRELNRMIEIYGSGPIGHDATKVVHFMRYLEHTLIPAHAAARAKITLYANERLVPTPPSPAAAASSAAESLTSEMAALEGSAAKEAPTVVVEAAAREVEEETQEAPAEEAADPVASPEEPPKDPSLS